MFSIYFKTRIIMLFSCYKADFLRFPPENPANYVSILMYELQRKASSERRKSHFRGPRSQNFPGEDSPGPPTSARFSASVNKTTRSTRYFVYTELFRVIYYYNNIN